MERYQEYKDSGEQWLGVIPSHWEVRKIKFTFKERSEKGYSNEPLLAATQNHGVILKADYESRTVEATKGLDTLKLVEIGDFVISLRSFQGGLEYAYNRGIISPAYTVLTPIYINKDYFKYLAKSQIFILLLKSTVTGIREGQNIDYSKLKEYSLPIPPTEEQRKIGIHLDRITAQIDKAIDQQQRMIDLLNERKQIIIQHAVTKGLDPNAEMVDSRVEWCDQISASWNVRRLRYLCKIKTGNKDTIMREDEGQYPFFVRSPKVERINSYTFDTEAILMSGDGAGAGRIFHYYKGKFGCHQRVYCFYDFAKEIYPQFLYYQLSEKFKEVFLGQTAKSTVDSVRLLMLKDFQIIFPILAEQRNIVEHIKKTIKPIEKLIVLSEQKINFLRERKQIIINEVVTGKVKVS